MLIISLMLQKIINLLRKKTKTQFLKPKPHHCLLLKLLMEHHQQVNTKFKFFWYFILSCYPNHIIEWVEAEKKIIDNKAKPEKRPIKITNADKVK